MDENLNSDFARRVVIDTNKMAWTASPQAGVERRMLDRVGGEVARATTVVRYQPNSVFPQHEHGLGEEFLVLDGVFEDEHGKYPAGTYVRNPPGSRHAPRTVSGCTIFVKLRQMRPDETGRVVIDPADVGWHAGDAPGHERRELYCADRRAGETAESVGLERLAANCRLGPYIVNGGEEIFLIEGNLIDQDGKHGPGTWIRNPPAHSTTLHTATGALYWVKRGHLPERRQEMHVR